MACHHPKPAYLDHDGRVTFVRREKALGRRGFIHIRCRMCRGCKADHAREWAIRAYHESSLHAQNCFVNPTYSPDKIPPHGTLDPRDLTLFFKRLRKAGVKFRYFASGEYGEKKGRPHYHICIFGWQPNERPIVGKSAKGHLQYGSKILDKAWGYGHITWTDFDPACAHYVAHYTADKLKNYALDEIDPATGLKPYERMETSGEIIELVHEFQRQSTNPGIGMPWLKKNWREVFPADSVVMNGREYPPPEAYYKYLKEIDPATYQIVQAKRKVASEQMPYETGLRQYQKANAKCAALDQIKRPTHEDKSV